MKNKLSLVNTIDDDYKILGISIEIWEWVL
jgi:hypothetical protein